MTAHLTISATARGLNYLPEYYADATGLFADQGLEVSAVARDPWTGVLDDLESGAADLALGGLWVPAMFVGSRRHYTVIGQLNHQFPMAIVTRAPAPDFTWADLTGKTVLAPGAGGSAPYEFTAGLMREAGVDPAGTRFVRDLSTAMLVELFTAGLGDAIIADLVTATMLQDRGVGHISQEHAVVGGTMPNSVYYCRTERLDELEPVLVGFVTALSRSMAALADETPDLLAGLVTGLWPDVPAASLRSATGRLLASRTWETTSVDPAACDRWTGILQDAGLVTTAPSFDALVTTRITDAVRVPA